MAERLRKAWNVVRWPLCGLVFAAAALGGIWLIFNLGTEHSTPASTSVNWLYTVITGGLLATALGQIVAARAATAATLTDQATQRRKWATLQACDRYDTDPELTKAIRFLRAFHPFSDIRLRRPRSTDLDLIADKLQKRSTPSLSCFPAAHLDVDTQYTISAGLLLNYFDSIAIGIKQGFYDEAICREHIGPIFKAWTGHFQTSNPETYEAVMSNNYAAANLLLNAWANPLPAK